MMRKRLRLIAGLALMIWCLVAAEALPQQHITVKVSPDGSLIIMDKTGIVSKDAGKPRSEVFLVGSHRNMKIIRGSTEMLDGSPIITRGRGNSKRRLGEPKAPLPEALSANPQPSASISDAPIAALIDKTAQEHGLDPNLVRLVVQKESGFNSQAVSPKGAMGLMQLMPGTAALLGVQDPFNPAQNIDGGVRYLKQCLERFNNDVCLALAAYNAGPENVAKYQGVPPFAETRNYVANIVQAYTGRCPDLPQTLPATISSQAPGARRTMARKAALPHAELQPLFLPGGARVNIIQSGRAKIFEIHSP